MALCFGIFLVLFVLGMFQIALEAVGNVAKYGCGAFLVLGIIGLLIEPSSGHSTVLDQRIYRRGSSIAVGIGLSDLGFLQRNGKEQ